jgi:single-stranded-DNA-specific exonuclease
MGVFEGTWIGICIESEENMKKINESTKFVEKVVGVSFEGRQAIVALLSIGEQVNLVRDPLNRFDRNAIKIVTENGDQFGFLDRNVAASLSVEMDRLGIPVKATVLELPGGYYEGSNIGVLIGFSMPE